MSGVNYGQKRTFFRRRFTCIATAAIVLIPSIYTTLFLGSMWDPYGNVESLPVAVVNEDIAVDYDGKTLQIGDELVERLKESDQLDFYFPDAKEAEEGLEDGTYYMVITIPSDFSENASTLLEDEPKKMVLSYSTNPGTNYIASKMSESALAKIEKEISESVTEEYAETIFNQLGEIGTGMTDAADGASEILDGVTALSDGNAAVTENLGVLSESTLAFVSGSQTLEEGLITYTDGVTAVNDGAESLENGISEFADGTDTLTSGALTLNNGMDSLYSGISSYTDGVSAAYTGASKLSGSSGTLTDAASELSDGAYQLQQGSDAMTAGLESLSSALSESLSDENTAQITQVNAALTQLQQGIETLNSALNSEEFPDIGGLAQTLTQSLTTIGENAQDAAVQLESLQTAFTAMIQTEAFQSLGAEAQRELTECFSEPLSSLAEDVSAIGTQITVLSGTLQSADLSGSADLVTQMKASVSELYEGAEQALPGAQQAINVLYGGLETVQETVDEQLLPGSQSVSSGLSQLSAGSDALSDGFSSYSEGVSSLAEGLETLDSNTTSLLIGSQTLLNGTNSLTSELPTLTAAVDLLRSGTISLSGGTSELNENSAALCDGISQLTSGAEEIQSGAEQLSDGSAEIGEGLETLSSGTDELRNALSDGAEEINTVNFTDLTYNMLASPVESSETYAAEVASNGDAMAAYMMSVGLWVAGLAFCVMLSPHDQKIKGNSAGKAWIKQIAKLWILAVVQAILMVICLTVFNGFSPENTVTVIIIACIASIAFLTIEYCLNFFLGIIGSFILLVFMVLQLSGCAGTYPKELSAYFYQAINPFMPFTYAVHGFRSGIASGADVTTDCAVFTSIAVLSAVLLLIGFCVRMKKQRHETESEFKY